MEKDTTEWPPHSLNTFLRDCRVKNIVKYQESIQGIISCAPELNTGDIPSAGRQQFSLLPKCIFL